MVIRLSSSKFQIENKGEFKNLKVHSNPIVDFKTNHVEVSIFNAETNILLNRYYSSKQIFDYNQTHTTAFYIPIEKGNYIIDANFFSIDKPDVKEFIIEGYLDTIYSPIINR
jgi:hypothetical protein